MKRLYILFLIFLAYASAFGQGLSPSLLASSGDQTNNATYKTSWSVGDLIIDYKAVGNTVLAQGFQQGLLSTSTISGNAGIAGATLSYTDGTAKTATADGSGIYSFTVSYNWSGTVTPAKPGYTFNPASKDYTNVISDQTAQNYVASQPMQLKFTTTAASQSIALPFYGTVNCTVNWGDGTAAENFTTAGDLTTTGDKWHTFATANTYTVSISGSLTQFGSDSYKWTGVEYLTQVISFGEVGLTSLLGAFYSANNLTSVPVVLPATVSNLRVCFYSNTKASITNLDLWDVSHVTNMFGMFQSASAFNQNIGNWDVSSVTSFTQMFMGASAFNQNIGNWIVGNVTNMASMFRSASAFNQNIGNWNVGNVTAMSSMFRGATAFNQPIGNWDVSKVTTMATMFNGVTLSTANYDAILTGWATQTVKSTVTFDGGNSKYSCSAAASRAILTGAPKNWTITDGGADNLTTWNGSSSSDWNAAANWSCNTVPAATDNVLIPHVATDPVVNLAAASPALCNNLTIESGAVLTIPAGKALTVNGTLTNNAGIAGLVVQSASAASDGTGSLINGTAGVLGTVERYVSGNLWHLISPAATAGETVASFVLLANGNLVARNLNNYAFSPWNEGTGTNSGLFGSPAQGFQVMRADGVGTGTGSGPATDNGKLTFKGTLAAANINIPVTKSGNGWNLIGNPYPCALDVKTFIETPNAQIDPNYLAIYVSNIGDVATKGYSPVFAADGLKLAPGEGFFVKTKTGGGSISFTTNMKSSVSAAFKAVTFDSPTIRLTVDDGNGKLGTTVQYIGGATKGLDPGKDAGLFNGTASSFSLFTRLVEDNGVDFTVQALPDNNLENMVVPVGLVADKGATVTFKATVANLPAGYQVVLEDKGTGTFTRLDVANSSYTVSLEAASIGTGRF